MSGARPESPEDLDLLAGEYALGVPEGEERQTLARRAGQDPAFARALTAWEHRLAPMLRAVETLPPPEGLWARIEQARLGAAPMAAPVASLAAARQRRRTAARVWPWQVSNVASLALAAGLAAFIVLRQPPPAPAPALPTQAHGLALVAVLSQPEPAGDSRPESLPQTVTDYGSGKLQVGSADAPATPQRLGFVAAAWPDGTLTLTPFAPLPARTGRLAVSLRTPGATAPRALGDLPSAGRQITLPEPPPPGSVLTVTAEPSGRTVFSGTLAPPPR